MRPPGEGARAGPAWTPTVLAAYAYGVVFSIFAVWALATYDARSFSELMLAPRLFGLGLAGVLTALHAGWAVGLLLELRNALRSPFERRRARSVAAFLAILLVVALQIATLAMRDAAIAYRPAG